jgi:hypothetical protein
MEKEIDCSYTDEVVCPYCGFEFGDSYELFEFNFRDYIEGLECDECKKEFNVERCVEVTFNSYKKK